jgi:RHS repeat-associated protein
MNYNLNRMSASPGVIYTHDMVGNRTAKSVGAVETRYEWDAVNRMTKLGYPNSHHEYVYRSDGMRVRKIKNGGDEVTRSYYDGQMPIEEDFDTSGTANDTVTRNFVGARGLEAISTTQNSVTNTAYPLYDTHGNMVATLSKNTAGTSWSVANERSYDVWGGVRSGATTGGPKGRYVANLGHVQDDESGLIYMRARYYEPETGRFVSEDRARDGLNWFGYCNNDPINKIDKTGNNSITEWSNGTIQGLITAFLYGLCMESLLAFASAAADIGMSWILAGKATYNLGVGKWYEEASIRILSGSIAGIGAVGSMISGVAMIAAGIALFYTGTVLFWHLAATDEIVTNGKVLIDKGFKGLF